MVDSSIIDLLKADLQDLIENAEAFIPVIGYEKAGLAIKYRLPETGHQLDAIARKVAKDNQDPYYRNLWTSVDTMIFLCDGLYVKPDGVEDYVMLDPQETGQAVRFDARMAAIVDIPEDSPARVVLKKVFGNNEMAILSHSERLGRWLNNTKADLVTELWQMGEM